MLKIKCNPFSSQEMLELRLPVNASSACNLKLWFHTSSLRTFASVTRPKEHSCGNGSYTAETGRLEVNMAKCDRKRKNGFVTKADTPLWIVLLLLPHNSYIVLIFIFIFNQNSQIRQQSALWEKRLVAWTEVSGYRLCKKADQ